MHIDKSLVAHLSNLSRLHFTEDEMVSMQSDLEKMIGFVEKLNELDTSGVEPLMHMSQVKDVFRADLAATPIANSFLQYQKCWVKKRIVWQKELFILRKYGKATLWVARRSKF
jgi:aspartyl-tRNA(Asn)/glutamyl-tRNA(Gln) amidotransferase subunit C